VGTAYEADLLSGQLQQAGIEARSSRSADAPGAWLTSVGNPSGPIDVFVPANDLQAAQEIVSAGDVSEHPASGAPQHQTIRLVGRALLAVSLFGIIAVILSDFLGW